MEGRVQKARSWMYKVTPRKFLCFYNLKIGSYAVGAVMTLIMLIMIIGCLIQAIKAKNCEACSENTMRVNQGFCITAVIYCFIMFLNSLWLFCGIYRRRASIVGGYVAVSMVWYLQTLSLLLVLIFLYSEAVSLITWLLALIFGLLAMAIILYGILVILGYWLQLKSTNSTDET